MIESSALLLTAKRYAQLFGVTLRVQGAAAYTNGKTITIPRFNCSNEYNARLAYGYIAHESGHVKYTDFSYLEKPDIARSPFMLSLFNILEDCRIEQLMSRNYIGVAENLELLNMHDKERQRDMIVKSLDEVPVFNIYAMYIQCYGWVHVQNCDRRFELDTIEQFLLNHNQETTIKLRKKLQDFYKKDRTCDETYRMTRAIARLLRTNLTDKDMTRGDKDVDANQLISDQVRRDSNNKLQASASCAQASVHSVNPHSSNAIASAMLSPSAVAVTLQDVSRVNSDGLSSRDDLGEFKDCIAETGREDFGDTVQTNYGIVNALRNYIRAKITSLKELSEQGHRLNVKRLVRVPCGETKVFLNKTLDLDHNTNVQLLVDASSSMAKFDSSSSSRLDRANKIALIIARALDKLDNVDRAVYYFPGRCSETEIALKKNEPLGRVQMARFDQRPRGSTPLAQAMWQAFEQMRFTDKERNVLLVITDGVPDSIQHAENCLDFAEKHNVEVYCISIHAGYAMRLFKHCAIVENEQELLNKATGIIKSLFNYDNLIKQLI